MKKAALMTLLTLATVASFTCLAAYAAEPSALQTSIVPADAQWVLHLDMERLVSSDLFRLLTESGKGADIQQKAGLLTAKFKLDPFKDIKGVTVFGRGGAGADPVVAVSGSFNRASLVGLLKAEASTKEEPYGKYTIYSWQGEHFGAFADDSFVLIAEKEADIKSALDVLDGKAGNAGASPLAARLKKQPAGSIVEFVVADIAGLTGGGKGPSVGHDMPAMLSQMKSVDGVIAEIGDKLSLKINIGAATAQVAGELEQAIRGILALVNLQFKDGDAQLISQGISVKSSGETVMIDASYPVPELTKMIQEHKERKAATAPSAENKE